MFLSFNSANTVAVVTCEVPQGRYSPYASTDTESKRFDEADSEKQFIYCLFLTTVAAFEF